MILILKIYISKNTNSDELLSIQKYCLKFYFEIALALLFFKLVAD